ncbi:MULTISPECIES: thioredoxin [Oligella]|uniref:Thioredoxin n=2 Tax=Oligella urethralis TaxID=90245 RepID=A0A096AF84_9BURK|nr:MULTISPECIES: thioredoxin [Oligella]AVL71151.1 thioredoxin [Oligella urethralis]KGF29317.1 thioredoxin [Oligella urethralis DNF00040]MDK6203287.1 thioredoxin [Oligella urethralis]OFS88078.1 thiol reductase thioredoxin [Oligella sp. HMSC05A10]OFV47469.1 thiol reductase thioredoxin [Oligella sp. HMSC09E12]
MSYQELTKDTFQDALNQDGIVVIDFWAPWCGPCQQFSPTFEAAAEKHTEMKFFKVNTDEEQEIAQALKIRSIPTLMIFRDRILLFSQPGALAPAQFEEVLTKVKEVDMDQVRAELAAQGQAQDDKQA